ncbi:UNKNOWN [Stylonychia lemnae]|uniref:Alginate lyase 2 domain-containing protein n=1 Tax=Stylonychia lemnae TaxID=5949 RepID=A0A078A3I7_STYLE|nr:UNKNOWN [Stylonychia lemnae]|eukprot:CDW76362.1 UNKNOWN [Stylonychia lemnae]
MLRTKTLVLICATFVAFSYANQNEHNHQNHHNSNSGNSDSSSQGSIKSKLSKTSNDNTNDSSSKSSHSHSTHPSQSHTQSDSNGATHQHSHHNSQGSDSGDDDLTKGWHLQHPEKNVQYPTNAKKRSDRYQKDTDGTEHFEVHSDDKPFEQGSKTKPRTEMRNHNDYTSGKHQFSADFKVPKGTNGATIMQIFGGDRSYTKKNPHSSSFMMQVHDGDLTYYNKKQPIEKNIAGKWEHVNVIHDADKHKIDAYLNGKPVFHGKDNGNDNHYFKYGVYGQEGMSPKMEVYYKNVNIYDKKNKLFYYN